MALDRKINFLLGKNDVGVKSQLFPRKKIDVCVRWVITRILFGSVLGSIDS